ncbi:RNase H family protein [Clavispora lusitaniae]|uniref:RNase H family protein n=1 Tax=Clavispora lusitaniae TaxID=36911 RepID=UPI00202C10F2|nr:RNase H family protein [Clavispora lusitaniae]
MGKTPYYYAVANGRNAGVYKSWDDCKSQVSGFSNAKYKKFSSAEEASRFVSSGSSKSSSSSYQSYSSGSSGRVSKPEPSNYSASTNYGSKPRYQSARNSQGSTGGYQRKFDKIESSVDHSISRESSSGTSSDSSSKRRQRVYVDGAARGNGKSGIPNAGYGVYFGPNDKRNVSQGLHEVDDVDRIKPTNQRAELHALVHALDVAAKDSTTGYEILTDSAYAKNCVETWADKWEANGWVNTRGEKVANKDLVQSALTKYREAKERHGDDFSITHVRGHSGIEGNEQADSLANKGADDMTQARRQ